MDSCFKQKIPLIIMVAGAVILVISISLAGILFWQGEYKTINRDGETGDTSSSLKSAVAEQQQDVSNQTGQTEIRQTGKSDSISVSGKISPKEFDAEFYAKRLYELKYLFGVDGFKSISDISTSAVVQFTFCHLYYESLVDMPDEKDMIFRQVLPESISAKIEELFGKNKIDISKSDLYNPDKKVFEMWQPRYSSNVYADIKCSKSGVNTYEITATFFLEKTKNKADSIVTGVFKKEGSNFILTSMQTKQ
jgi:hypothetical protein